jgi:hypothetical protein
MVGGTTPPQSDSGEISRVLVLNLLWRKLRFVGGVMSRYLGFVLARIVMGLIIIGMVLWAVSPNGGGEKEFARAKQALRSVRSYKYQMIADSKGQQYHEGSGEMDCQNGDHTTLHIVNTSDPDHPFDQTTEEIHVTGKGYSRTGEAPWIQMRYMGMAPPDPKNECQMLAAGRAVSSFPDYDALIKRAMIGKGDKKTVNGVRCREWKAVIPHGTNSMPDSTTVCLGLDDHLPYEVHEPYGVHLTYRDFNVPVQIEEPEVVAVASN